MPNLRVLTIDDSTNAGIAYARYNFAVDGGTVGLKTPAVNTLIPDNSIITGGCINVTTQILSSGLATVSIGLSAGASAASILAATAKANLTLDRLLAPIPSWAVPLKLTAPGNITFTIAVSALTAGVVEVWLEYYTAAN